MDIQRLTVSPDDARMEQGPLVRAALRGGCDIAGCHCSDHPYLFVSDGDTAFTITLSPQEAAQIMRGRLTDLRGGAQ